MSAQISYSVKAVNDAALLVQVESPVFAMLSDSNWAM